MEADAFTLEDVPVHDPSFQLRKFAHLINERVARFTTLCLVEITECGEAKIDLQRCALDHAWRTNNNKEVEAALCEFLCREKSVLLSMTGRARTYAKHQYGWLRMTPIVETHCEFWLTYGQRVTYAEHTWSVSMLDSARLDDVFSPRAKKDEKRPLKLSIRAWRLGVDLPNVNRRLAERVDAYWSCRAPLVASELEFGVNRCVAAATISLFVDEAVREGLLSTSMFFPLVSEIQASGNLKSLQIYDMDSSPCVKFFCSIPGYEHVENAAYAFMLNSAEHEGRPITREDFVNTLTALFTGLTSLCIKSFGHDYCSANRKKSIPGRRPNNNPMEKVFSSLCENLRSECCTLRRVDLPEPCVFTMCQECPCMDEFAWNVKMLQCLEENTCLRLISGLIVRGDDAYAAMAEMLRKNTTLDTLLNVAFVVSHPSQLDAVISALRQCNTSLLYLTGQYGPDHHHDDDAVDVKIRELYREVIKNRSLDVRARAILKPIAFNEDAADDAMALLTDAEWYVLATVPRQRMLRYVGKALADKLYGRITDSFFRLTRICMDYPKSACGLPKDCWRLIARKLHVIDIDVLGKDGADGSKEK